MDTNVITPAVQLDGLTISFPSPDGSAKTVVDNLDLTIPRGQFVSLVGRSGCGKTTLLNALAGLVDATEGKTEVLGTTPFDARSRMGFMMARDALFPWRTARKNVEYGLELRGVPKAERRTQSARWLAAVQMSEASRLWTWQLSQGMRQRVALARTWALDPDILLMDEPFAALDAQTPSRSTARIPRALAIPGRPDGHLRNPRPRRSHLSLRPRSAARGRPGDRRRQH